MRTAGSSTKVSDFKTGAWQSQERADAYHKGTVAAPAVFQIVRQALYLRYVQRYAPTGARFLDLGCGSGLVSIALHDLGYTVVACDASQGMLNRLSQERGDRNFELRLGSGFDIPARDGEFDMVVSRMFIQHFPNWPLILREKARVTRRDGIVLFDFGNREHVVACDRHLGRDDDFPYCADPAIPEKFYAVASQGEMSFEAKACGLEVVDIAPHGLLLNNAFLWKTLKADGIGALNAKLDRLLQDDKARELLLLIEEECLPHLPRSTAYGNVTILRRTASTSQRSLWHRLRDKVTSLFGRRR